MGGHAPGKRASAEEQCYRAKVYTDLIRGYPLHVGVSGVLEMIGYVYIYYCGSHEYMNG